MANEIKEVVIDKKGRVGRIVGFGQFVGEVEVVFDGVTGKEICLSSRLTTAIELLELLNKTQDVRDNLAKEKYFLTEKVKDLEATIQELETERQRLSK
jgi:hypothetical protein